ncbi:MAG: site-specific integrase [Bacteroidetes bacterium]|nr:site-specific integrase [Bacteroidota bacterium]
MKPFFLSFYIKKDKVQKSGIAPIYARLTVNGEPVTFSTGQNIHPNIWKRTMQLRLAKTDEEKKIRRELLAIESSIQEILHRRKAQKSALTAQSLKEAYFNKEMPQKEYYLSDAFHAWLDVFEGRVQANSRSNGTLNKYKAVQKHLAEFMDMKYKKSDIRLQDIKYEFVVGFDLFMRNNKAIGNNTAVKYMRFLSVVMNHAIKLEYVEKNPFIKYDGVYQEEETVFLTEEEILRIQNYEFNYERLQIVADIFIFCCYTGYAPVDLAQLTWNNVKLHSDGQFWVFKNRQKTKVTSNVPLLPPAMRLIEKYRNHRDCVKSKSLFPMRQSQKQNATLKMIQEMCSINKKLTCYVSRHSFACLMLSKGIELPVIADMMGHKRVSQTQHYAKVLQRDVSKQMKNLSNQYKNIPPKAA